MPITTQPITTQPPSPPKPIPLPYPSTCVDVALNSSLPNSHPLCEPYQITEHRTRSSYYQRYHPEYVFEFEEHKGTTADYQPCKDLMTRPPKIVRDDLGGALSHSAMHDYLDQTKCYYGLDLIPNLQYLDSGHYRSVYNLISLNLIFKNVHGDGVSRDYRNGDSRENNHSSRYDREVIVMKELGGKENNIIPLHSTSCHYDGSFLQLGGGSLLAQIISENVTPDNQLSQILIGMANGLRVLHANNAIHTDIDVKQWVVIDGTAYLQDFNRVRFLDELPFDDQGIVKCKVFIKKAGGSRRAPEEYNLLWMDEKVDVWSLGLAVYEVLFLEEIWATLGISRKREAPEYVKRGEYAEIAELDYKPIAVKAGRDELWAKEVLEVIKKCLKYEPEERPKAGEVRDMLKVIDEKCF